MRKLVIASAVAINALTSSAAFAAEKTVTLRVNNMYCADCPYIVKKSLESVPGGSPRSRPPSRIRGQLSPTTTARPI